VSVLHTDRLVLRRPQPTDAQAWHRIWGDQEVVWWGPNVDLEATQRSLARLLDRCAAMRPGLGWWVIEESVRAQVVGTAALQASPVPEGSIEIGWHLRRDRWDLGYATEAASAVLKHGFTTVGLERIVATIVPENARSIRVAHRLGMVRTRPDVRRGGLVHGVWEIRR
jgi:RimJ/RimL family protein N-acetyltransferase